MAIGFGAAGSWAASNATTQTVTLPSHAAGNMLLVRVVAKHATLPMDITCSTAGWTRVGQGANGTTASGNGTGSVTAAVFYKIATSSSETNPVIVFHASTAATPAACVAMVYTKGGGEIWAAPYGDRGSDTSAASSYSASIASHIPVTSGDYVDFFAGICDDTTMTVPSLSQTGVTYAAVVESPATALLSTTSNDISADGGYRSATSGTSSAAAVVSGTLSTSETGVVWMTRLRVRTAQTYYIAPTGNDTTGSGAIGSPWRTIQKFLTVAAAGDILNCRGGTYSGTDIGGITSDNTKGTPESWITVRADPTDAASSSYPVFDGASPTPQNFFWNLNEASLVTGSQYIDIDGLRFTGWRVTNTGMFTAAGGSGDRVHHIRIHNIVADLADNNDATAHAIYMGPYVHDFEIDNNQLDGKIDVYGVNHNGRGVQIYAGGTGGADRVNVHHNFIRAFTHGVLVNDSASNDVTIQNNTFIGCYGNVHVEDGGTSLIVRSNAGGPPLSYDIYDPLSAIDTNTNNVWSLTIGTQLTTAGLLMAGSPAIGAAHDAGDSGWKTYVSSGTPVGKDLQAIWHERAVVGKSVQLQFRVRAVIGKALQSVFNVKTFVGKSLQSVFNVDVIGGAYAIEVLADSPRAYWRLGEPSGNPQDSSGNAHHVNTVGGTPNYNVTGALVDGDDGAMNFDGSTEYLSIPHATALEPAAFSIEAWVAIDASTTFWQVIAGKDSWTAVDGWLLFWGDEGIGLADPGFFFKTAGDEIGPTLALDPTPGQFYHVVATYDGTDMRLYVDGVLAGPVTKTIPNSGVSLNIGARHQNDGTGATDFLDGQIDEVAFYQTALSGSRITAHYNAGLGLSAVGKALQLVYNQRAAVGKAVQAVWNMRAKVGKAVQSVFHVKSPVGKSLQPVFHVRAAVGKSVQSIWNAKAAVGKAMQSIWDVLELSGGSAVGKALDLRWNLREAVGKTVESRFNVRAPVGKAVQNVFHVRAPVNKSLQARFNVRSSAGKAVQSVFHVKAAVGKAVQAQFRVRAPVGKAVQAQFRVRAGIGKAVQAVWNEKAIAGRTLGVQFAVRSVVGKAVTAQYRVREGVMNSKYLLWHVVGPIAPLADDKNPENRIGRRNRARVDD